MKNDPSPPEHDGEDQLSDYLVVRKICVVCGIDVSIGEKVDFPSPRGNMGIYLP